MAHLKQISKKLLVIILDILLLGYRTFKQLALPGKKRKGNLLSSLFVFFVGVIERLGSFEHGVFSMVVLFKQKRVRKVLLICCTLLCLLSSFEWCGNESKKVTPASCTRDLVSPLNKTCTVFQSRPQALANYCITLPKYVSAPSSYYTCFFRQSLPEKKYLLFQSLQI